MSIVSISNYGKLNLWNTDNTDMGTMVTTEPRFGSLEIERVPTPTTWTPEDDFLGCPYCGMGRSDTIGACPHCGGPWRD